MTVLFFLALALSQYTIIHTLIGNKVTVIWEMWKPCGLANLYITALLLIKVMMGLTHGLLDRYPLLNFQYSYRHRLRKVFNFRLTRSLFICEYLLRVSIFLFLLAEILIGNSHPILIEFLDEHVINLLFVITITCLLQIVSPCLVNKELANAICCQKQPTINSDST